MRRLAPAVWVTSMFVALTLVFTYPLSVHPGSFVVPGGADTELFIWTLGWNTHALFTRPWDIFHANIYYPQNYTLAYSENLIGTTPFAAPAFWFAGNPVLALNMVQMSSVVLCGTGAYFLARRLGSSRSAAIIAGVIFAFSPARFFRYGQLHLTTVQWVPFTLAFLHTYLQSGNRRQLWLAIGFFTLQVLTSGHAAVFASLGIVTLLAASIPPVASAGHRGAKLLRDFGWQGALLLLPAVLLFAPYLLVQQEIGLRRTLENWAATPESFLATPAHVTERFNSWLAGMPVNDTATAFMFPGYVPIALALIALAGGWGRSGRRMIPWLGITALALLLSMGPPLSLWPYVFWLPGFNFVRVPSRFMILALVGIATLAAIGFDRLTRSASARTRALSAAALLAVLTIEFATMPFTGTPYVVELPAIDRWLATRPKPFVVAEVPVGDTEIWHTRYMLHSMAHWQKTVHGYSGIRPPLHDELFGQLREFPDEEGVRGLRRLGVDYLVVHTERYEPGEWPDVERRLNAFSEWLVLEHVEGEGRVYAIRQRP